MRLAYLAATRATCERKHVGAVIVSPDHRVVATGYNGAPSGAPSCDDVGHQIVDGHCVRTIHSEANAISYAGRFSIGCTIYGTASPCYDCAKLIVNAGISRVVYDDFYPSRYNLSDQVPQFLREAGLGVVQYDTVMLAAFKKKLKELEELENSALATTLVEYGCGCTAQGVQARVKCPDHGKERIHE